MIKINIFQQIKQNKITDFYQQLGHFM